MTGKWGADEDRILREMYDEYERKEIAQVLGRSEASVRGRCTRLGLNTKKPQPWTFLEDEKLKRWICARDGQIYSLDELAEYMGRSRWGVAMRLSRLGFGDYHRVKPEGRKDRRKYKGDTAALRQSISDRAKAMIAERGHPRGFLGSHHSDLAKRVIGEKSKAWNAKISKQQRRLIIKKSRDTKMARYGTIAPNMKSSNAYSRARGGKREDLNNRYFRSSWEANYARYLNWLKAQGEIKDWQYEPDTFYFEGVRRGAISYTPDFKITENDGRVVYHEIKGWMDSKSKTKLKRMGKYYPAIEVVVIGEKEYRSIAQYAGLIPNWEARGHGW